MREVAEHDLRDISFIEKKLDLNLASQFATIMMDGKVIDLQTAIEAIKNPSLSVNIIIEGDALPVRTGKFWNLKINYVTSPLVPYIESVNTTTMLNIFDVEEYACITHDDLQGTLDSKNAVPIGNSSIGYKAYHIREVGKQEISIVFIGPDGGRGCIVFLGIWQYNK